MDASAWKILLVDDDEEDYFIARQMLARPMRGEYVLVWAASFDQGWTELRSGEYDAALIDHDLGASNGLELTRRAIAAGIRTPIILYTGRGTYEADLEAMEAGATLYLTKGETSPLMLERGIRYAIERRQMELDLQQARMEAENEKLRLEAVMAALPVGIAMINTQGLPEQWNRAYEQIWGLPWPPELSTNDLRNFHADWVESGQPVRPEEWASSRAVERNETVIGQLLKIRRPTSGAQPDESQVVVLNSGTPVWDVQGKIIGSAVVLQDVTPLWEAEARLQESEARFRTVFERAEIGIALSDLTGRLLDCNPRFERMTGYTKQELQQRGFQEITYPEDLARELPLVQELMDGRRESYAIEKRYICKDGQVIDVHLVGSLARTPRGGPRLGIVLVEDISERKRKEAEREQLLAQLKIQGGLLENLVAEAQQRAGEMESIFAALAEAVIVYDDQGQALRANPAAVEALGFDPTHAILTDLMGKLSSRHLDGRRVSPMDAPTSRALAGQMVRGERYILTNANGREINMVSSATPLWKDGRVTGAVTVWHDISQQERLLEEVQRQAAELDAIITSITDGVIIRDAAGKILRMNPAAERITGYTAEERALTYAERTSRVLKIFDGDERLVTDPKDLPSARVMRGEPVHNMFMEIEHTPTQQKTWILVNAALLHTPGGEISGSVIALTDVNELKLAQDGLQQSRQEIAGILESIQDGFFALDRDWRFIFANQKAADILGLPRPELAGQNLWECFPSLRGTRLEACYRKAMDERVAQSYETEAGPAQAAYEIRVYPSLDGVSVYWIDISRRKRVEQALREYSAHLEQSNRALEDFASTASHDLQEPLRKIEGFGKLLAQDSAPALDPDGQDYLARMLQAAGRMNRMVQDLLALSRVTSQGQPFARVDLNQVARDVLEDLESRLRQSGGRVELGDLPVIQADPTQMHQLLQNLIGNGLKFCQPGQPPLVRVDSRCGPGEMPGGGIEIQVSDNGIGFDPDRAGRLFQPFQRLHERAAYEGTGIGLSICRKIVERHGGQIRAQSQVGQGAVFIVSLPVECLMVED